MKKFFITAIELTLLLIAFGISAQDTVYYGDPRYMFNPRVQITVLAPNATNAQWMHENCVGFAELGAPAPGNGKLMSYFTKDSVTVYGVAIAMDSMDCDSLQYAMFQGTLGKKVGGIMTLVDTATALNGISVNRFCYSIVGNGVLYEKFVPLYEYYFDHPHVLCDSFFVGYYKPLLDSEYVYYRNVIYYTQADSVNTSIMCRDPRSTEPMVCTSPHGWGARCMGWLVSDFGAMPSPSVAPGQPGRMGEKVFMGWRRTRFVPALGGGISTAGRLRYSVLSWRHLDDSFRWPARNLFGSTRQREMQSTRG